MRSKHGPGERDLQQALSALTSALNATGVPWMIIGGIAVIARGVRRMTTDIDAAVRGDQADVSALLAALARKRITPRIDDAERFARESLVLLLRHRPTGVELDVSMAWTDFEHGAIAASSRVDFGTIKAPMAQAEIWSSSRPSRAGPRTSRTRPRSSCCTPSWTARGSESACASSPSWPTRPCSPADWMPRSPLRGDCRCSPARPSSAGPPAAGPSTSCVVQAGHDRRSRATRLRRAASAR